MIEIIEGTLSVGGVWFKKKTNEESKRSATVEYVYDRVMKASKLKNDIEMIARLNEIPNKDLVAYDAHYHRGSSKMCLLRYTELSTVATIQNNKENLCENDQNIQMETGDDGDEIQNLRNTDFNKEHNSSESDAESLNNSITHDTESDTRDQIEQDRSKVKESPCTNISPEDKSMIYNLVTLIRMKSKSCKVKSYPAPSELGIKGSIHYVSQHLLLLILWLVDKQSYDNVSGFNETSHEFKVKALSLTECVTSNIGSIITPLT